jgi:hypothetical protein
MSKRPGNHGKEWSGQEVRRLRELARENTPTRVIGIKLERTPGAVRQKAHDENISLAPWNQRPYNRRQK